MSFLCDSKDLADTLMKNDAFLSGEIKEWSLFTPALALAVLPQYNTPQELFT